MSLFPAYKPSNFQDDVGGVVGRTSSTENTSKDNGLLWLNNSSYTEVSTNQQRQNNHENQVEEEKLVTGSNGETGSTKYSHKKKKKKSKKEKLSRHKKRGDSILKPSVASKILENDQFYEDKKQERGNFLVSTLYYPAIPRYDKYGRYFKKYMYLMKKLKKERKVKRYFIVTSNRKEDKSEEYNIDPSTKEEELTKLTEDFNKRLADNPGDVAVWLDYVRFQDTVFEFENTYRKNPIGGKRVTLERKLAILERAIQNNPSSEQLLMERLGLAERVQPAEQMAEECVRALMQDPGNLTLWRALVRTTRNSSARCTAPGVLQVFSKAITRVGQLRLHRQAATVERDIISLVLECGLFLQQAGLWEQLWTLLQTYVSLSLTASGQFHVPVQLQEGKLREQEDSILASGLPLSVLWLRVEKLRAACHFLPDPNCDSDPQRVVFSDDISGLLQPLMTAELRLPLVVTTLVLLKVPLLPTRHCLLRCLGLLDVPSAVNNIETLLAAVYSTPCDSRYLSGAADLVCEPQYMKDQQGQPEYLSWVVSVMQHCADLLPSAEAVVLHSWTMRLYALLCRLHSLALGGVPVSVLKAARSHAKQLLKLPQFRDNLLLYAEYALIERAAEDLPKACKVLEMAVAMPLPAATEPDVHHVVLCRRLVECLLMKDSVTEKEHAVRVLVALVDCQPASAGPVSEVTIKRSVAKWQQQTSELEKCNTSLAGQPLTVAAAMAPHVLVEWLACHALLLTLTHTVWDAAALLHHHIDVIPHTPDTLGSLWVEQLYEVLIEILHRHTSHTNTNFALLRDTLVKAIASYPNNLSLLNFLATIETKNGGGGTPLWKLVSFFPPSVPLARLVLVFVVRSRVSPQNSGAMAITSGSNYLKNLLRQLTEETTTDQCPLVWRLYLQLVAATDSAAQVKAVFYKSLQACPWIKALYLDAVKFLPEELPEIQDLLIEKELRLHTTPEELEILRD